MTALRRTPLLALLCLVAGTAALAPAASAGTRAGPLETGIFDPDVFYPGSPLAFDRVREAGAHYARIWVSWRGLAPDHKPSSGDPWDPEDPVWDYHWASLDQAVTDAVDAGLEPVLLIFATPRWAAQVSACKSDVCAPDPAEYADFAHAVAARYDGRTDGLPRVRYFQAWNEANIHPFFLPQFAGGQTVSPEIYRSMLNFFSGAVKDVNPGNLVITSGLAPLKRPGSVAPLEFMRQMLCMHGRRHPRRVCPAEARFDIWSTHPYTPGSPVRHGYGPDDTTIADLPKMTRLLRAAERQGAIRTDLDRVPFWVTEFSWDTKGPDPEGVPLWRHARWTAEALYRMWRAGVSNVFWFQLRDQPGDGAPPDIFQSGLYFRGDTLADDRPKPALHAFHFPFVALPEGAAVQVWGRTPDSEPGWVRIQVRTLFGWETKATLFADRFGIFKSTLRLRRGGVARAVYEGRRSTNFWIKPTRNVFQRPFGRL